MNKIIHPFFVVLFTAIIIVITAIVIAIDIPKVKKKTINHNQHEKRRTSPASDLVSVS
jgi:preprotein translocase subunit SecY